MIKYLCPYLFIFFAVFGYSQEISTAKNAQSDITFRKNISYSARQLKLIQKLNDSGDSLIIETEKKIIRQIDIMNDDYLESVYINGYKGKIDLSKLANGNYVIQARIGKQWIVMSLEKKDISSISLNNDEREKKNQLNSYSTEDKSSYDKDTMYWVVYEINSSFSSRKSMGLKYRDQIDELISKIKLEIKTNLGKRNKLLVYKIYDRKKFITKQLRNSKYYQIKKSKLFNTSPIYSSEYEKDDLNKPKPL